MTNVNIKDEGRQKEDLKLRNSSSHMSTHMMEKYVILKGKSLKNDRRVKLLKRLICL